MTTGLIKVISSSEFSSPCGVKGARGWIRRTTLKRNKRITIGAGESICLHRCTHTHVPMNYGTMHRQCMERCTEINVICSCEETEDLGWFTTKNVTEKRVICPDGIGKTALFNCKSQVIPSGASCFDGKMLCEKRAEAFTQGMQARIKPVSKLQ